MRVITFDGTFENWRKEARDLLSEKIHFNNILWQTSLAGENGFTGSLFDSLKSPPKVIRTVINVPREFIQDAEIVAAFRDETTWALLYKLAYRIVFEEKDLMQIALDDDVLEFTRRKNLVTRDLHKMKAFVRFREIKENEESIYMAWHRSDHRVLKFAAPFFTDRFQGMNWIIFTEDESMSWVNKELRFGPGISQEDAEVEDDMEELWTTYFASIFNPARIKINTMKRSMPVRYWKTLPEAAIIDQIVDEAPERLEAFYESQRTLASIKMPEVKTEKVDADIVFISETPMIEGSETKKLWDELLSMAGIKEKIYLTAAVKSNESGDEKAPSFQDISAYRPILKQEIDSIKPKYVVCLGASAAQAVFGKLMKLRETQRKILKTSFCEQTIVLSNPKTFLRTKDEQILSRLKNEFVQDLKHTLSMLTSPSSASSSPTATSPAQS